MTVNNDKHLLPSASTSALLIKLDRSRYSASTMMPTRNDKATLKCRYALYRDVGYNSTHPPKMEIHSLKMACGCPCDGVVKTDTHADPPAL